MPRRRGPGASTRKTGCGPTFVREVLDAVADGDDEAARALVGRSAPCRHRRPDRARAGRRARRPDRSAGRIVDADVYAELNDYVREDVIDEMEPQQVADLAAQLDTDDAVALIEDLEAGRPAGRAPGDGARRPGRGRGGARLSGGIRRPPDAARPVRGARPLEGRPGDRLSALDRDELPTDFWEVFVVSARPIIRSGPASCRPSCGRRASTRVAEIMARKQTLIPVDLDQEEVALKFQKYALISAAVVDASRPAGRHDHGRRHRPHHPGRGGRGRAAAVRRRRGRHQRAGGRHLQGAGPLAGGQPADRAGRDRRSSAFSKIRSSGWRCWPR